MLRYCYLLKVKRPDQDFPDYVRATYSKEEAEKWRNEDPENRFYVTV